LGFEFTQNRLDNSELRVNDFINDHVVEWTEEIVLLPIRNSIIQTGLSQNAANAVRVEKTGYMKAEIVWDYEGPNGEPLYEWLENGFGKGGYNIKSKGKLAGGADYLRWKDSNGKPVFRKKVRHPGFAGYGLIKKGWEANKEQLKRRAIEETNNFLEVNRLS
jgi:hypothetical protein